jgi:hypothetical protein
MRQYLAMEQEDSGRLSAEQKSGLATWLPILTSIMALSVSLGTLYYDHFREKHSLRAVISEISWHSTELPVELVFRNLGNKAEVVKSAKLVWDKVDPNGGRVSRDGVGALVIKPDEVTLQRFTARLPAFKDIKDSGALDKDNGLHIGVLFTILDSRPHSSGSRLYVEKIVPFTVLYFDDLGNVTGAKPTRENADSFVELYNGVSVE